MNSVKVNLINSINTSKPKSLFNKKNTSLFLSKLVVSIDMNSKLYNWQVLSACACNSIKSYLNETEA